MGRGKAKASLDLIDAAREILEEIQPATVRAVCYRLFVAGVIDSMTKTNTNKVSRLLVDARETEVIPWEWIVDETRAPETISTWTSPQRIFEAAARQYRFDYWTMQPNRVEVWSEKGTVRGTLAPILDKYAITMRVMHGHASATAINDAAEYSTESDEPLHILYVGDFDPSGMHMSEVDIPRRIDRYGGDVQLQRVAIERGDLGLPSFPASDKTTDPRHKWFVATHGTTCVELDAMSPVVLRRRVERTVLELLDRDAWDRAVAIEEAQREATANYAAGFAKYLHACHKVPGKEAKP